MNLFVVYGDQDESICGVWDQDESICGLWGSG